MRGAWLMLVLAAGIGALLGGTYGVIVAVAIVAVLLAIAYTYCEPLALSAMRARPVSEVEHPELYRLVRELSNVGRLPVPRLAISPSEQPNSFSVGRSARTATVCCTEGLLRILNEDELRGVLGHELAHLTVPEMRSASVSAGLATMITFPAGVGRLLPGRGGLAERNLSGYETLMMLLLGPVAALLIRLTCSSRRESIADSVGATLTRDPRPLANALRKIDVVGAQHPLVPDGRLTSISHLMIAFPFRAEGFSRLFLTQPPTGERVRSLEETASHWR